MFVLVFEPYGNLGSGWAKVFPTYELAYEAMSDSFHGIVTEHGLEVRDGRCDIDEDHAYTTPDGSGEEWHIYEALEA